MRALHNHDGTTITTNRKPTATSFCIPIVVSIVTVVSVVVNAQTPPTQNVTLAPIQCWTRASSNAVRVGELFTLVLTCAVVETQSTTVVPDQSRLDPGALQVPPFEVVSGTQAPDLRTRTHRYFQYEYQLRFIGEQIGGDLDVPGPTINYRVQSRVQGNDAVESRERQYVLPSTRVRIASLVPLSANDIHDELPETFRQIEDRRFRANVLRIVSWVLFAVGALVFLWALAALFGRRRKESSARRLLVPEAAVLAAAARELASVRRQRQVDGWTSDLAARALTPLRIAASYATGRPVAQTATRGQTPPGRLPTPITSTDRGLTPSISSGQIVASSWFPRPRKVYVSGAGAPVEADLKVRPHTVRLDTPGLGDAIATLSAAAYGRTMPPDSDLDEALDAGARGIRDVARRYTPWARLARALKHSALGLRDRAWAR